MEIEYLYAFQCSHKKKTKFRIFKLLTEPKMFCVISSTEYGQNI